MIKTRIGIHNLVIRLRHAGLRDAALAVFRQIRDRIYPPWYKLYWIAIPELSEIPNCSNIPAGGTALNKYVARFIDTVDLRIVSNLDELTEPELQALGQSVGASALRIFGQRLSRGVELHILFADGRVVGTVFYVLGRDHPFQHVVLTERDAMGLDGRIDFAYRGRGLYPVLLFLSMVHLSRRGIERLFADCTESNQEAARSFECVGFRFLMRYRLKSGGYVYDHKPL